MNALLKTFTGNDNKQRDKQEQTIDTQAEKAAKSTQITIKDLLLTMFIGVYEYEQHKKQRVRVNITLDVTYNPHWEADNIENVVAYDTLIEEIQELAEDTHFNLVETLAEEIIEICLEDDRVLNAKVGVEKLDVCALTSSVGVMIERSR